MWQELVRIPLAGREIPIYGFGLMMVLGFLAAAHLSRYLARRAGLDGEAFINGALIGLFTGVAGARLSHVLENLSEFTRSDLSVWQNLANMANLQSGGLTYYGGFLLAFPTLLLYARWKKIPIRQAMDIVVPGLLIAMGVGRIGCFLNGCCYGARCDQPWAVHFPYHSNAYVEQAEHGKLTPPAKLTRIVDGKATLLAPSEVARNAELSALARHERALGVHPAQLYSAFTLLLLAGLTYAYYTLPHAPGRVFALMLMLEGTARFTLELVRSEPAVLGRMSLSMVIGIGLVGLGALLWHLFGRLAKAGI